MKKDARGQTIIEPLELWRASTAWDALASDLMDMGRQLQYQFKPVAHYEPGPEPDPETMRLLRRLNKKDLAQADLQRRIQETQLKRQQQAARKQPPRHTPTKPVAPAPVPTPKRVSLPTPPVPVQVDPVRFDNTPPLAGMFADAPDLCDFLLHERASLWWVSNQSDDLLCLPYCAIERLEYQLRPALHVIDPMRGRALLSDEVGLGKTIEAGLVLKEYLTRGMVNRCLVLTLPSLVDQWEEELDSKFNIPAVTTNHAVFRADPVAFWRDHEAVIASIHTLKGDAHLAAAQHVGWNMLIVDEAHSLRHRTAKTWQAVNALPRQFLLLLTATPVQNSIEEIHNLVTLLQPGQLLSPKEFRDRFVNKDKPREPRDPDELRRLLGQVMIRNTRSNAGVKLPPRRAGQVSRLRCVRPLALRRAPFRKLEKENQPLETAGRNRRRLGRVQPVPRNATGARRRVARRRPENLGHQRTDTGHATSTDQRPVSRRGRRVVAHAQRHRGTQPPVLSPTRQFRSAVEPDGNRAAHRPPPPARSTAPGRNLQPRPGRHPPGPPARHPPGKNSTSSSWSSARPAWPWATGQRDASSHVFPGCPLTFRLAESLWQTGLPQMRAVLSATPDAGSPPTPAVAAMSWQNQFGQPSHLDETAWTPAWHYSMVATVRCEIQAIDQLWSCHRLAIALTTGDRNEGLNKIEQRQQRYLGRELARLDEYFTQYKAKLTGRLARHQKTESKSRYEDRLKAAHAEHAHRRADQIHRHAIRVIPHLDTILMVSEPAWQTRGHWRRGQIVNQAIYVPRARRWVLPQT